MLTCKKKFQDKLKKWIFLNQKKYKKYLTFKKNPNFLKKNFKIFKSRNKTFNDEKRIFLGCLRFIPFLITSQLKHLPMPWVHEKKILVLKHKVGILFLKEEKNLVLDLLFFSQWNIWWILTQKEKLKRKIFHRINFPIFDDFEKIKKNFPTQDDQLYAKFSKNENFWFSQNSKEWAFSNLIFYNSFLRNSFNRQIFIDYPLFFSFLKIQILSGLKTTYSLKNQKRMGITKLTQKILFFTQKNFIQKILKKEKRKKLKNGIKFTKNLLYPLIFTNQESHLKKNKIKNHINFLNLKKFFQKQIFIKKFQSFKEKKHFEWFGSNFLKKSFTNFPFSDFLSPFFSDFLFSEKRIFLYFEKKNLNLKKFSFQNSLKWPFKIPILRKFFFEIELSKNFKTFLSYYYLLKNFFFKKKKTIGKWKRGIFFEQNLSKNFFIEFYETNWIDSGIQICFQSHQMMVMLLGRKNLTFLHLDFNFNLKPTKTLTTKERKKSRFSNSFHLLREILRFTKIIIDIHLQFKLGNLDFYQLSDGVHYIFTHIGHLTGIYRYKYKIMKQIHLCKSIKRVLYEKFNKKIQKKGPGFGFWAPVWRIWIFFLRGAVPVLERWLSNLLSRHFFGRLNQKKSLEKSKQRTEAYFDIGLKNTFLKEINESGINLRKNFSFKKIFNYFNRAWNCWKSSIFWDNSELPEKIKNLILKYLKLKSNWWIRTTYQQREKIIKGAKLEKNLIKKNLGRMTRLWFKNEKKRQYDYLQKGPFISKNEGHLIYEIFLKWLEIKNFPKIPFPSFSFKTDLKLLILSVENLKESYQHQFFSKKNKKNQKLDNIFENPLLTLSKIKEKLLVQRIFSEIGIQFLDNFSQLIPIFKIQIDENLTDNFLDHFLWFEGKKSFLFPDWVKPIDSEILPFHIHQICSKINEVSNSDNWDKLKNIFFFQTKMVDSFENIDLGFLDKILKMVLNPFLGNFITSRLNSCLCYKDMKILNSFGLIKGLKFSGFIIQLFLIIKDLLIMGLKNASLLSSKSFILKKDSEMQKNNTTIFFYSRYITNSLFLMKKTKNFQIKPSLLPSFTQFSDNIKLPKKKKKKSSIKFLLQKIKEKIPISLGQILIKENSLQIKRFQKNLSTFSFELCGFEILVNSRFIQKKKNFWIFPKNNDNFSSFLPSLSNLAISQFQNKIHQLILTSNSTTFAKISNKWNSNLIGNILFFRESSFNNLKFQKLALESEDKIQIRIKIGLNTKMPSRFPPVLFYSPRELGGLGMLSVSNYKIHENDLKFSKIKKLNTKISDYYPEATSNLIPSLNQYFLSWDREFSDSKEVWIVYLKRRLKKKILRSQVFFEDVEDLLDRGIPRINTLFQKDRHILAYDHGWRIRGDFKKFQKEKTDPFWWTNKRHDGKLWNLNQYRIDILKILGGIGNILEHTLFKGTFFSSWEGLFWEKASGFEENFDSKKLTQAQRAGLNQIPNRRFTLWWSPTINRADVYVGFQVQLDLTGIFMHGKIPTLKISLIQIFRGHLWRKIHESIVLTICQNLEKKLENLKIQTIQKEQIHPRKSFKTNSSCADITIFSIKKWPILHQSLLSFKEKEESYRDQIKSDKFWFDIQIRWGDFDSHDIGRYSRSKFFAFTNDQRGIYPCQTGLIISFDLAYNISNAFGYWIVGLKLILRKIINRILKTNLSLFVLRERIKKSLQLYSTDSNDPFLKSKNFFSTFQKKKLCFVDDSCFYRIGVQRTKSGNLVAKPINGALFFFNPQLGDLFLKISHISLWERRKRLSQFSKWKAGEIVNSYISLISQKERPQVIVSLRKNIIDSIKLQLLGKPEILVKGTEIRIPFQNLLKLKRLGNEILCAQNSKNLTFNLYDKWLNSVSTFTAFSRVILILKGLENGFEFIKNIFGEFDFLFEKNFWPIFSNEKWIKIEILLKDLIIEKYCRKFKIQPQSLSQNDIKNIIFGVNLNRDTNFDEKKAEKKIDITSKTFDKFGKNLLVSFSDKKNEGNYLRLSNWKIRFGFLKIPCFLSPKIIIDFKKSENFFRVVLPRNLLKYFLNLSNKKFPILGLLFGKYIYKSKKFLEVRVFLIPPQIFFQEKIEVVTKIPKCKNLQRLKFFGIIRFSTKSNGFPDKNDNFLLNSLINQNFFGIDVKPILLILKFKSIFCHIKGFLFAESKGNFFFSYKKFKIQILLTARFFGFFLIPKSKKWNFSFQVSYFFKKMKYFLTFGLPEKLA